MLVVVFFQNWCLINLMNLSAGKKIFAGLGATAVATPFIQKAFGVGPYEEIEEEVEKITLIHTQQQ